MLLLLPFLLALGASEPAPAANSAPRPTPLTEIGRVRALPACVPIVAHANGAITQALDNDRALAIITTNLRNTDFDRLNFMQRRVAIEALMKHAEAMRVASSAGDVEIKKLREYAVNSPDPNRKVELKTFADALGGALYRQKKAAVEFMRDITVMRGREDAAEARAITSRDSQVPMAAQQSALSGRQTSTLPDPPAGYNKQLQSLAESLELLNPAIMTDEGNAADHSIAATAGC